MMCRRFRSAATSRKASVRARIADSDTPERTGVRGGVSCRHKDNVLMGLEEPSSSTELQDILKQYSSTIKTKMN